MKPEGITRKQWLQYNYYFSSGNYLGLDYTKNRLDAKKKRLFADIARNSSMQGRGGKIPTETIECNDLTPYLADKEKLERTVLLFRNKAKDWPCMEKWTEDFFVEKMGNYRTEIIDNMGLADDGTVYTETNMATFVKQMKQDKKNYLRFSRIVDDNPELKADMDTDFISKFKYGTTRGDTYYLFMGEAGTKTEMHHAMPATVFVQIRGKKTWTIYAPEERVFLDPVGQRMPYHFSKANPHNLNDPDYPLLKYAKYYQFTMNEGDVMWMPPFFWHYVENPTASIGVAFKYVNLAQAFRLSKLCTWHYLTATNPNIISSYFHNKKTKHDLLYEQQKKNKKHKKQTVLMNAHP